MSFSQRKSRIRARSVAVQPEEGVDKQEGCDLVLHLKRLELRSLLHQLLLHRSRSGLCRRQLVLQATAPAGQKRLIAGGKLPLSTCSRVNGAFKTVLSTFQSC